MTRFRGAKVCSKWLQERIDDHNKQSDYKCTIGLQSENSVIGYVCVVTLHDYTTDTNDNITTKTDFHTEHINMNTSVCIVLFILCQRIVTLHTAPWLKS